MIGPYDKPKVRLPGSGGATEIATGCQRIYVVMRHNPRAFVRPLAFVTSLGHGVTGRERRAMGIRTEGPMLVVTDLCTMTPDAETKEFEVVSLHPGRHPRAGTREYRLGRPVRRAGRRNAGANDRELEALRDLNARTALAHGTRGEVVAANDPERRLRPDTRLRPEPIAAILLA